MHFLFFVSLVCFLPSSGADPICFTDIAESAGLSFVHRTGARGEWHFLETMGSGCALFDADGDGDLDLYVVNGANLPGQPLQGANALYRNDAEKPIRFSDITQEAGVTGSGYGMGCTVRRCGPDTAPADSFLTAFRSASPLPIAL